MQKVYNYIGGKLCEPCAGQYMANIAPATGEVYSLIPDSDGQDVEMAVQAAKLAFPAWSARPASERADLLLAIAQLIEDNLESLALAESIDSGKPLALALSMDIPRARDNFRFYATAILHQAEAAYHTGPNVLNYTLRQPIGVAGCISPWNLPLYLFTWKIAPALASGNCVVAKPSEVTPMTAFRLAELCIRAGLPKGVLNIVHGLGHKVGQAMAEHPGIPVVSFTGGTLTGQKIAVTAAPMFKKLSLELGGKNPNLVFADCDFDQAVATSVRAAFTNQGEICLCGSRILIERSIYDQFRAAFVHRVAQLRVGDPLLPDTNLGAVVSAPHRDKILSYIDLAQAEGGRILTGGGAVELNGRCAGGYFVAPTVIEGLPQHCRTNMEEIFGPVVTLQAFDKEEEALALANATQYGLAATVWTENLTRAHRVAQRLESGIVWINCWLVRDLRTPFGGVKHSGLGREGGFAALHFFTEEKNVCLKLGQNQ